MHIHHIPWDRRGYTNYFSEVFNIISMCATHALCVLVVFGGCFDEDFSSVHHNALFTFLSGARTVLCGMIQRFLCWLQTDSCPSYLDKTVF